jgi:hypothetical protein
MIALLEKLLGASWRTTLLGWLMIAAAVAKFGIAMFDNDSLTIPDWGMILTLFGGGGIGVAARDNKVTSEQANPPK